MTTLTKQNVIEAICWSERMTKVEAEHLYSVTSERYHTAIHNIYLEHLKKKWKKLGWYHPIYNPMDEYERMLERAQLKIIFVELLLSQ